MICYILYGMNDVYIIKVVLQERKKRSYCEQPSLNYVLSLYFSKWIYKGNNHNLYKLARDNLIVSLISPDN